MDASKAANGGGSSRRRRRPSDRVSQAILVTAQSMAKESPDSLTFRAIARKMGIAPSSIYDHFANLDELKKALAPRGFGG